MIFISCKIKREELQTFKQDPDQFKLSLCRNIVYPDETKANVETGLMWTFSFLGAQLPKGSFNQAVNWENNHLKVDFDKLGFSPQALKALANLIVHFKQSEEYRIKESIDIGRFIALTLNSSHHYYAIVGIPKTLTAFKSGKIFDNKQFASTNSSISIVDRIIDLPDSNNTDFRKSAFIANECVGKIKEGNGQTAYIEVKEQMANGQFRFAIYDTTKRLLPASKGPTGKPAKCIWCHETVIQPLFAAQQDEPGFYTGNQFNYIIDRELFKLNKYRKTLWSDLDFEKHEDHEKAELLYISFMEPNAERLAQEWEMSIEEVKAKLNSLPTHRHHEFDFLGELYNREDVDKLAPFESIKPPTSAREKSIYEPNLIP